MKDDSLLELKEFDAPSCEQALVLGQFLAEQNPEMSTGYRAQYLPWKLSKNYIQAGFATAIIDRAGERIVSLCTVTPKKLWINSAEVCWAETGDTFTREQYLRRGMFSKVTDATRTRAQTAGFSIVYGLPNEKSLPGYIKNLNFSIKEDVKLINLSLPLSTLVLARKIFPETWKLTKKIFNSSWLAAASRKLVSILYWPYIVFQKKSFSFDVVDNFGPEFDQLWELASKLLPVVQVRDSKYLSWRYKENPYPFKVIAIRERGSLVGYAATLMVQPESPSGLRHFFLSDWLFVPGRQDVANAILASVLELAFSTSADAVSALMSVGTPCKLSFRLIGFHGKYHRNPVIIHQNIDGKQLLENPAPWHFTLSDTDMF